MKHPELPYVCLVWDDAVGGMTGKPHELQHQPERRQTYGWILRSDDVGVSIASDWVSTNEEFGDVTFVPRAMVVVEVPMTITKKAPKREKVARDPSRTDPGRSASSSAA